MPDLVAYVKKTLKINKVFEFETLEKLDGLMLELEDRTIIVCITNKNKTAILSTFLSP